MLGTDERGALSGRSGEKEGWGWLDGGGDRSGPVMARNQGLEGTAGRKKFKKIETFRCADGERHDVPVAR